MPGPLTPEDLLALWNSVTDAGWSQPIREAGSGEGYEVIEQAAEMFGAVATASDTSAQELFVLPHSGQTNLPASGAAFATATVTLERTARFHLALVLDPGVVKVEHIATDFGELGAVAVKTNRRYGLASRLTLGPGEAGPQDRDVRAEKPGSGHNQPLAGTLTGFFEPAAGLGNDSASIEPGPGTHRLRSANKADAPVHQMIGLQVEMLAGANIGQVRRAVGYLAPESGDAGSLLLAPTAVLAVSSIVGAWETDELVTQSNGATGLFRRLHRGRLVIDGDGLIEFVTGTITGSTSGTTATVDVVEQGQLMTAEAGTVTWVTLSYERDLGMTCTNVARPSGGRDASLDLLGQERGKFRGPEEQDDSYRLRVAQPLDTVSPGAVVRAANRALAQYGAEATLREVGTLAFPGFFHDAGDSYDLDAFAVTGSASGIFVDGELVVQDPNSGGAAAVGRAQVRSPGVAPGTVLPAGVLLGVAGIQTAQPFVSGFPIFGLSSSSHVALPSFSGGPVPGDELRVSLDYDEFRGFMLIDAPIAGLGEFGIAYDAGPNNAYDAAPYLAFYDGFALTSAVGLRTVWQAVDEVRAGGVGFDVRAVASA